MSGINRTTGGGAVTGTIANSASLSGSIDLRGGTVLAIEMPSAWTTANLTFQGSIDDNTFNDVYDSSGNEYTVTAAASRWIDIPADKLAGINYLKVRSGTSSSAVSQGAARTINVVTGYALN